MTLEIYLPQPHFYRCGVITAKLPGPSLLHVCLLDDIDLWGMQGALQSVPIVGSAFQPKLIGETVVSLEDRWYCEEWRDKTGMNLRQKVS